MLFRRALAFSARQSYVAVGDDARFSAHVEAMVASTSAFLDTDHGLDTVPASEYVLAPVSPRW